MLFIAGRIAAMSQVEGTRTVAFCPLTAQESVFLLGIDIADKTFLCLEIEGHRIVLVGVVTHLENRRSREFSRRVGHTRGMDDAAVKTHVYLLTLQFHRGVVHLGITIEMGCLRYGIINEGVAGLVSHRSIDAALLRAEDTVGTDRVVDGLVMPVDGKFQRIHLRGVGQK